MDGNTTYPLERNGQQSISLIKTSLIVLVFSAILLGITRTVVDPDLWGHLRFGLDTLRNGYLARQDPYAYTTAGQVWINHEWLAEVIFALAWRAGGNLGLILLKDGVEVLTLALAFGSCCAGKLSPYGPALYVLLFLPAMLPSMWTVRPQMFTNLMFALVLFIILMAERGHYGWLWVAPPAICFWMNTHGGVLAGTAILFGLGSRASVFPPAQLENVIIPLVVALLGDAGQSVWGRFAWFSAAHSGWHPPRNRRVGALTDPVGPWACFT